MKRVLSILVGVTLLLTPSESEAQIFVFGGQQTWTAEGAENSSGLGGGIGFRTGILPIFDLAVDASYFTFPEDGGAKLSSLNYSASAILGGKKERVNIYAGAGQYNLRADGNAGTPLLGAHVGLSLHLIGPFSADARLVFLEGEDGKVSEKATSRIIPITLRLQF